MIKAIWKIVKWEEKYFEIIATFYNKFVSLQAK
jgi:hypothetical protein